MRILYCFLFLLFSVNGLTLAASYNSIEVELASECDANSTMIAFQNSSFISFVKPDFESFNEDKISLIISDEITSPISINDIKKIAQSVGCDPKKMTTTSRAVLSGNIEIEVEKNCMEERAVEAFTNNPNVVSVEADFGFDNYILNVSSKNYISNTELKSIADAGGCKILFTERK